MTSGSISCRSWLRTSETVADGQQLLDRAQRTPVQKLQLLVVSVIRGRDDIGSVLGEGESLQELGLFLEKRGVDREVNKKQLTRLDKTASLGPGKPQALVVAGRSTGRRKCSWARFKRKRLTWSFGDSLGCANVKES